MILVGRSGNCTVKRKLAQLPERRLERLRECRHPQEVTEMSIEDAKLGKLTKDHLNTHD